jgi:hypothetical protein
MLNVASVTDCLLGKGIIMLLSGPPGVGKTLTAESGMMRPADFVMSPF